MWGLPGPSRYERALFCMVYPLNERLEARIGPERSQRRIDAQQRHGMRWLVEGAIEPSQLERMIALRDRALVVTCVIEGPAERGVRERQWVAFLRHAHLIGCFVKLRRDGQQIRVPLV